jgi:glutamine amidotransferase
VKFKITHSLHYKIPHIGWNTVEQKKDSALLKNIPSNSDFYFVHAYHMHNNQNQDILGVTDYEYSFVSAIEKDNIFGVQFHPEKSHDIGNTLLENFTKL